MLNNIIYKGSVKCPPKKRQLTKCNRVVFRQLPRQTLKTGLNRHLESSGICVHMAVVFHSPAACLGQSSAALQNPLPVFPVRSGGKFENAWDFVAVKRKNCFFGGLCIGFGGFH